MPITETVMPWLRASDTAASVLSSGLSPWVGSASVMMMRCLVTSARGNMVMDCCTVSAMLVSFIARTDAMERTSCMKSSDGSSFFFTSLPKTSNPTLSRLSIA